MGPLPTFWFLFVRFGASVFTKQQGYHRGGQTVTWQLNLWFFFNSRISPKK